MMPFETIQAAFSPELQDRGEDLLREYLQYEILKLIFEGKYAHKYTFLGGTCLRICYATSRFSEDLDFDNVGLSEEEFEATAASIKLGLERLGFTVTIGFTYKGAFHCKVRFPALLFDYNLSPHKEAKVLIKLDTEKQHYDYERALIPINKFGIQTDVLAVPLNLLASQKIAAIMGRKRPKGRDYFDLCWILTQTTPEYGYLEDRFGVADAKGLRALVAQRIAPFNFDDLAQDVRPFLFIKEDIEGVRNFPEFWKTVKLD